MVTSKGTAGAKEKVRFPEFREFIKENDQQLYDFCHFMSLGAFPVEKIVLDTFREFGDYFRRSHSKRDAHSDPWQNRLHLFRLAWQKLRDAAEVATLPWSPGRDTRPMRGLEEDLLARWRGKATDVSQMEPQLLERLGRIDLEFRAPLVLRDILRFEDEETMSILGARWGVYRHRLHRGRVEMKEALRGCALGGAKLAPGLSSTVGT